MYTLINNGNKEFQFCTNLFLCILYNSNNDIIFKEKYLSVFVKDTGFGDTAQNRWIDYVCEINLVFRIRLLHGIWIKVCLIYLIIKQ